MTELSKIIQERLETAKQIEDGRQKTGLPYSRVSTAKQYKFGNSYERQIEETLEKCNEMGLDVLGNFAEPKSAGTVEKRKMFKQVMELIKSKKVDYLVMYSYDRMARDSLDYLEIKKTCDKYGTEIVLCHGRMGDKSAIGNFENGIKAIQAQFTRDTIKERTQYEITALKKDGKRHTNEAMFGFDWYKIPQTQEQKDNDIQKYRTVIIPEELEAMEEVFRLKKRKVPWRTVCKIMDDIIRPKKGGNWNPGNLLNLYRKFSEGETPSLDLPTAKELELQYT